MSSEAYYNLSALRPYDETMWDNNTLYDNMPYEWSMDTGKVIALESGNVIKGYRCKIKEPYEIKHK